MGGKKEEDGKEEGKTSAVKKDPKAELKLLEDKKMVDMAKANVKKTVAEGKMVKQMFSAAKEAKDKVNEEKLVMKVEMAEEKRKHEKEKLEAASKKMESAKDLDLESIDKTE